jgi:hypothetical protein
VHPAGKLLSGLTTSGLSSSAQLHRVMHIKYQIFSNRFRVLKQDAGMEIPLGCISFLTKR